MSINIGIPLGNLSQIVQKLKKLLASEVIFHTKHKHFHWNVEGPHFNEYHKFFDEQAEMLESIIDDMAERIRSLGEYAPGNLKFYLEASHIKENTADTIPYTNMFTELLQDHETLIKVLRTDIDACEELKDVGTADFLTAIMETHEKMAWMVRATGIQC